MLISSHRKLLSSKAMVVNVAEKSGQDSDRQTKEIGVLSGIRIERSERGAPGEFDWLDKLSVDELRLLATCIYRAVGDLATMGDCG